MYHYLINGAIVTMATEWPGHTAMTDAEYDAALRETATREATIDRYVGGEITLDEVPAAYRDEAAAAKALHDDPPVPESEALNIIIGNETG